MKQPFKVTYSQIVLLVLYVVGVMAGLYIGQSRAELQHSCTLQERSK